MNCNFLYTSSSFT